jgi:hypothetical protein
VNSEVLRATCMAQSGGNGGQDDDGQAPDRRKDDALEGLRKFLCLAIRFPIPNGNFLEASLWAMICLEVSPGGGTIGNLGQAAGAPKVWLSREQVPRAVPAQDGDVRELRGTV